MFFFCFANSFFFFFFFFCDQPAVSKENNTRLNRAQQRSRRPQTHRLPTGEQHEPLWARTLSRWSWRKTQNFCLLLLLLLQLPPKMVILLDRREMASPILCVCVVWLWACVSVRVQGIYIYTTHYNGKKLKTLQKHHGVETPNFKTKKSPPPSSPKKTSVR